jgi:hypothetical protein
VFFGFFLKHFHQLGVGRFIVRQFFDRSLLYRCGLHEVGFLDVEQLEPAVFDGVAHHVGRRGVERQLALHLFEFKTRGLRTLWAGQLRFDVLQRGL